MLTSTIFTLTFIYFANWVRLSVIGKAAFNPRGSYTNFADHKFLQKITEKIGIKFNIKVQDSPRIFGYMPGTPANPLIVISRGAVQELKEDELEWLVLHEAGHCILWHVPKEVLLQLSVLCVGIILIRITQWPIFLSPVLALILAIIWYQIERLFEKEADAFALQRMTNPHGMVTANQKMKSKVKSIFYKKDILTKLFTPHLTYDERINLAKHFPSDDFSE